MPVFKNKNQAFFKTWSPEMAYVLGFFTADGNMIRNRRGAHFISLEINDEDLLIKIRNLLGSNHKISLRRRSGKWNTSHRLQIGSKVMFHDLITLGLIPNKSKVLRCPAVPARYLCHFVRGYFDGDGNVTMCTYFRTDRNKYYTALHSGFVSGSERFLRSLHVLLKEMAPIKGGSLSYGEGFRLFFSKSDSLALYNFMYKECGDLFLKRKREIFENYFNNGPVA